MSISLIKNSLIVLKEVCHFNCLGSIGSRGKMLYDATLDIKPFAQSIKHV